MGSACCRLKKVPLTIEIKTSRATKVHIHSKFTASNVKISEFTPANTSKCCPYMCPICLRYFSTILVFRCCQNYICHECAECLNSESLSFEISCPHCKSSDLDLHDVNPEAKIRWYTDSPSKPHELGIVYEGARVLLTV